MYLQQAHVARFQGPNPYGYLPELHPNTHGKSVDWAFGVDYCKASIWQNVGKTYMHSEVSIFFSVHAHVLVCLFVCVFWCLRV